MTTTDTDPRNGTVSRADWDAARGALLAEEKAMTRAMDALAAKRRALPRLPVTGNYHFETADGPRSLIALFDGCHQLITYHHMLKKDDPAPCSGCSMYVDSLPHPAHMRARDTRLVLVSTAPLDQIAAFQARMGWQHHDWVQTTDDFNPDHDVTTGFGLNVFLRRGDAIWRTYFTTQRGVEATGTVWSLLDITPWGRQEIWQDAPRDTPQDAPYQWWRLHDEYTTG